MTFFRKIKAGLVKDDIENFVGEEGNVFFNVETGEFRLSDGITPGGVGIGGGGGGGGGNYILPTASTTVKGGVKVDGTTITINNQVISGFSGDYTSLTNRPTLSTVSRTGSYNDLINKPTLSTVSSTGSYNDLLNKPVLFSGSYADLTNTPTLFSGSYADLTNKPTIPTNTNQLTNGSGFITTSALTGYATQTYVNAQGFITTSALTGYATQTYVNAQGFITSSALTPYALTSSVPTRLRDLTDVDITGTPSDGHVLKYNAEFGHWAPAADLTGGGGGGLSLSDLDASVNDTPSGNGDFSYDDLTGVFTYTPPDLSVYARSDSLPAPYVLPTASTTTLGGVKVDGSTINIDDGVISAAPSTVTIKTFNILNEFSAPLIGNAIFAPTSTKIIKSVQLTNGQRVGENLMVGLYRNNELLNFFTIPAGNFTSVYSNLNYTITNNDYITVNVVAGNGINFSMTLLDR